MVVGRSCRTFLLLTAFQELSGLQQNVHCLFLDHRKSFPMASKCCVFSFLSSLPVVVVLSCFSCVTLRKVSCFQGRCNHSPLRKNLISPRIQQAQQRTDVLSTAIPIFFKKEQKTRYPITLQTNSPEVICSPATWC